MFYLTVLLYHLLLLHQTLWLHLQLYKYHYSHVNLILTLKLYVPRELPIISTQFFVLNLVGWFGVLSDKFIIFWYSIIILLYQLNVKIINNFLSFFFIYIYISFFRYFFIILICNCLWIILLQFFWNFCNPTVLRPSSRS